MNCILTESALLGALTASQLEDIRRQAPAGEDPVTEAILTSAPGWTPIAGAAPFRGRS